MPEVYAMEQIATLLHLDRQRTQGEVTPHISGDEHMTDLEYRGPNGKYTLASVDNENGYDALYFTMLFNHAAAMIRQLLGMGEHHAIHATGSPPPVPCGKTHQRTIPS